MWAAQNELRSPRFCISVSPRRESNLWWSSAALATVPFGCHPAKLGLLGTVAITSKPGTGTGHPSFGFTLAYPQALIPGL
jgi:hypothetical protein